MTDVPRVKGDKRGLPLTTRTNTTTTTTHTDPRLGIFTAEFLHLSLMYLIGFSSQIGIMHRHEDRKQEHDSVVVAKSFICSRGGIDRQDSECIVLYIRNEEQTSVQDGVACMQG